MNEKKIVACLDVKNGKTTKGVKFLNNEVLGDPVEMAVEYFKQGADEIVVYDITASMENRTANLDLIKEVAAKIGVPLTVGGGISTLEHIDSMIKNGAAKVSINTPAVINPELIKEAVIKFGSNAIAVGIDVIKSKTTPSGYEIATAGGQKPTGIDAMDWIKKMQDYGAAEIIVNTVDEDGMRNGYNCELLKQIKGTFLINVTASGGAGKPEHVLEAFKSANVDSALLASMLHYGLTTVGDLKKYLKDEGIPVIL